MPPSTTARSYGNTKSNEKRAGVCAWGAIIQRRGQVIFKQLTQDQYNRLAPQERMDYLHRLMADIREKLEEQRKQTEAIRHGLPPEEKT